MEGKGIQRRGEGGGVEGRGREGRAEEGREWREKKRTASPYK